MRRPRGSRSHTLVQAWTPLRHCGEKGQSQAPARQPEVWPWGGPVSSAGGQAGWSQPYPKANSPSPAPAASLRPGSAPGRPDTRLCRPRQRKAWTPASQPGAPPLERLKTLSSPAGTPLLTQRSA